MGLTPAQHAARARGIGASDVAAILGLPNPGGRTIVDVWSKKRRGPALELEPYVVEQDPEPDTCDAFAPHIRGDVRTSGNVLEEGLAELYSMVTGLERARVGTQRSSQYDWALATPDRVVGQALDLGGRRSMRGGFRTWRQRGVDRGLEIKLVGSHSAADWPSEGLADHVRIQCQWGMFVCEMDRWDVFALLGGSEPRVVRLERDDALIAGLVDVCRMFWEEHVLGDTPPPAPGPEAAMKVVRAIWCEDNGREVARPELSIARMVGALVQAQRRQDEADLECDQIKAGLAALCGPNRSIVGPWGRFNFGSVKGQVAWKAVAEELTGGTFAEELLERHRGRSARRAQLYPKKGWIANVLDTGRLARALETAAAEELDP